VKEALGWEPKTDLETAIRRTIDYYLAQKDTDLDAQG